MCRADDVQVEFIMLDPYQRITMKHNNEVCTVPDLAISPCLESACSPTCLAHTWKMLPCMYVCIYVALLQL